MIFKDANTMGQHLSKVLKDDIGIIHLFICSFIQQIFLDYLICSRYDSRHFIHSAMSGILDSIKKGIVLWREASNS